MSDQDYTPLEAELREDYAGSFIPRGISRLHDGREAYEMALARWDRGIAKIKADAIHEHEVAAGRREEAPGITALLAHHGVQGQAYILPTPENREITDAQVEAAARVLFAREEPDMNDWRWSRPNPNTPATPFAWHDYWLDAARAALVAAREVSRG